ncbi:MAG: metal-dependent hydrolase [Chitinophagales bacterium]|nr:metal-dependent hydrolase [Chitinophagales bacterium]
MKFTYYGHFCFSVVVKGKEILFDPFITPNELASNIDISSIKPDYIFLTHGHEDHVADAIEIGKNSGATFLSNFELYMWLNEKGIEKAMPCNHGGSWNLDFGRVKFVNAVHSSVLPDGTYGGNPGGFVIESDDGNFYNSGDTALTMDMQLIPMTCAQLDFCVFPIGDVFTMGVSDAIIASDFVKCNKIIGAHYDTFEPIKINKDRAIEAFKSTGKELLLPNIGDTIDV